MVLSCRRGQSQEYWTSRDAYDLGLAHGYETRLDGFYLTAYGSDKFDGFHLVADGSG